MMLRAKEKTICRRTDGDPAAWMGEMARAAHSKRVAWRQFARFLAARGLRATSARRAVLEAVFARHDHFEAEKLARDLAPTTRNSRGGRTPVSRATVFRTLSLLKESGLLDEVLSGERHAHYEHVLGHEHHDHLVCLSCGRVSEFSDPEIERLQERACAAKGFKPVTHRLQISGYCRRCRGLSVAKKNGEPSENC